MNKTLIRNILTYAGIVLLLAGIAYSFVPQVLDGKIVNQSDIAGWKGMAHEAQEFNKANPDDQTAWTGSMFGGMPTTAIIDNFEGDWTKPLYKVLMWGKRPGSYLFVTLLGAFLLMISMGISKILAIAGAIAVAFCAYNMQIIQVGHNTKMQAIAFFPWVLAGVIFTYKAVFSDKKWLPKTVLGAVLFALALSMQIKANHIQITYYLAIVIAVYAVALFISILKNRKASMAIESAENTGKPLQRFFIASALLLVVGCVGIATNANKLIPTYEYTPYTMRGGSELAPDSDTHNSKGLDLEYATAWSYGINEMPNLLIPNFNGGSSSGALDLDSETGKLLKRVGQPNLRQTLQHMPLYWGPQPFTAGPMYMGAITIFLFVLGLCLVKGREKWWMVVATLIAVMLAWGNHFMWFTRLWFEYVPFYNKFRTVSMALIVLQVTLPLLGFYVLDKVLKGDYPKKEMMKGGFIAFGLIAGFCLLATILPGIAGTFTGSVDAGQPDILVDALVADRQALLKADALRSFVLIGICFGLIVWAMRGYSKDNSAPSNKNAAIAAIAIALVVLFDMFSVGKRYLNSDHFITPKNFEAQYEPRPVDEMLFEDEDPNFRVLDISINTFNSSIASYHHKTIGGYSPVKMQRYQDLIETYITDEIRSIYDVVGKAATVQDVVMNLPELKITSMLNGKYIVLGGEYPPVENFNALGHCWFVENFEKAASPDEEIALTGVVDLRKTAVIGADFEKVTSEECFSGNTCDENCYTSKEANDEIALTHYAPNELRYSFNTSRERAAIFSEIYYPKGWKAWIEPAGATGSVKNGHYVPTAEAQEVELFRADWILRGAVIPQGEGQLIMRFEPQSYQTGAAISRICSILLLLMLALAVAGMLIPAKRAN